MSVTQDQAPIDLVHLARYTGGDRALDAEVLTLFVGQAEQLVAKLRIHLDRADAKSWRETLHALKGAARGVGAFDLADIAHRAETLDLAKPGNDAEKAVDQLRSKAHAARLFVKSFLARPDTPISC